MPARVPRLFIAALLLASVSAAVVALPERAKANGRVGEFVRQVAGPYEIALGTIPARPVVGKLHLTLTVADMSSGAYILDAGVTVSGKGPEQDVVIGPLKAWNNVRDPAFYDLTVSVSGDLGDASADFPVEVRKASLLGGYVTWLTLLALLAVLGLSIRLYIQQRGRSRRGRA